MRTKSRILADQKVTPRAPAPHLEIVREPRLPLPAPPDEWPVRAPAPVPWYERPLIGWAIVSLSFGLALAIAALVGGVP